MSSNSLPVSTAIECLNELQDLLNMLHGYSDSSIVNVPTSIHVGTKVTGSTLKIFVPGWGDISTNAILMTFNMFDYSWYGNVRMYNLSTQDDEPLFMAVIRNKLLQGGISSIILIGYSYGGSLSYIMTYLISRIIGYHSGNTSQSLIVFVEDFYASNVNSVMNTRDAYYTALNLGTNPTQAQVIQAMKSLDRQLFSTLTLSGHYSIGSISVMPWETCGFYDNSDGINLYNLTHSLSLNTDPLYNLFGTRNWFGLSMAILSRFRPRGVPGQNYLIYYGPPWKLWVGTHTLPGYIQGLSNPSVPIQTYTYQTTPFRWFTYFRMFETIPNDPVVWFRPITFVVAILLGSLMALLTPFTLFYGLLLKIRGTL